MVFSVVSVASVARLSCGALFHAARALVVAARGEAAALARPARQPLYAFVCGRVTIEFKQSSIMLTINCFIDNLTTMVTPANLLHIAPVGGADANADEAHLNAVFQALSDATRRRILQDLDGQALLVSELAGRFHMSLQGVSRHIQVLVRAGLIVQQRSGRISRCSLTTGPLLDAALWLNRYAKYWQQQFDVLATTLAQIDARRELTPTRPRKRRPTPKTR